MPKVSDEHLAARRRQILDAALVRFSRQGFHQTPMQAIFEEAGLSPGAVYRYFKSKEEIVRAIASETVAGFADAVQPAEDGTPLSPMQLLQRLIEAVASAERGRDRRRLALQVWAEAQHNPEVAATLDEIWSRLHGRVREELEAARRGGVLDPSLDPDAAARVLVALAQGFVVQSNLRDDTDAAAFAAAAGRLLGGADAPPASST